MGSSRSQLAAALLLLSAFTLSHTASATFTSSNFWDFSAVHVGYKSPCTSETSLECTNDDSFDFSGQNAPKSCNQITVGCYSSYYTSQCSWERDDYCPSCSVVNGKVVLKCTKKSGSSCPNGVTNPSKCDLSYHQSISSRSRKGSRSTELEFDEVYRQR
jgi:hypothetical protein